jgi:hypothetical protein
MEHDDLMTVAEIAEKKGVSTRWIRAQIADLELDPDGYKKNTGARDTPLYSLSVLEQESSKTQDSKLVSQLSEKSKMKFMIGHVELEGTPEQVQQVRMYIDDQRAQIEGLWADIKELNEAHSLALADTQDMFHRHAREQASMEHGMLIAERNAFKRLATDYEKEIKRLRKQLQRTGDNVSD